MNSFIKIFDLLTYSERKYAFMLIGMILMMALLDMLGVASILPFMAVVSNPKLVENNILLNSAFHMVRAIGFNSMQEFHFTLGIFVFFVLVTSLGFKALTTYAQTRFALMGEYRLAMRLVESYLNHPYSWFLSHNSADLSKVILSEVSLVIYHAVQPAMVIMAQSATALMILVLLLVVDPTLALLVGVVLGIVYLAISMFMSGLLKRLGLECAQANQMRFTILSEAFGAIKEVKVGSLECTYAQRFAAPAKVYANGQAMVHIIAQMPRFALEAIAFGGLLLVMLYIMRQSGSLTAALPIITLYAFAGYRLMPALQQIYGAVSQLRYASQGLERLHQDLKCLNSKKNINSKINWEVEPICLKEEIVLNNVSYSYPNVDELAIKALNLVIPAHSTTGFVGTTGSGKTTTIDLILGLLEPQEGHLTIDGVAITDRNRHQWQRSIGYVPQHIFLADDTVAANIAFGVDPKFIDKKSVVRAAKLAKLHDYILHDLSHGYNTTVGERGVRLSGGQRQRLGIARALYHNPQILILDEATSSLDNLTEQAVMDAVNDLEDQVTIIMIAHRLSTVRRCNKIYLLDHGEIKAGGSYDELCLISDEFAAMAKGT